MKKIFLTLLTLTILTRVSFGQWSTSGANIYFNTGNIGIGTTTPTNLLHIRSNVGGNDILQLNNIDATDGRTAILFNSGKGQAWEFGENIGGSTGLFGLRDMSSSGFPVRFVVNTSGYIGIGTTAQTNMFTVAGNNPSSPGNTATFSSNNGVSSMIGNQLNVTNLQTNWGMLIGFDGPGVATTTYHSPYAGYLINVQNAPLYFGTNNAQNMTIASSGYIGIGTSNPLTRLHIIGNGSSIDGGNALQINGDDMAIQANTGGRSATAGAQLEFVIPANTDGTNLWGQARIITVAGNGMSSDATGKMILGTRRMFNKLGTGQQWYYGNDLVIDGNGNVGIGTTNPQGYLLAVAGSAIATSLTIKTVNNWPDYVFKPEYRLPSLQDVKTYIDQNQHLPEMPSAAEVNRNGIDLGETNKVLTKKVEELTLYLIEQNKQLADQKQVIELLQTRMDDLSKEMKNNKIQLAN